MVNDLKDAPGGRPHPECRSLRGANDADTGNCAGCVWWRYEPPGLNGTCHVEGPLQRPEGGFPLTRADDFCPSMTKSLKEWSSFDEEEI
jgi:hypothetical protein